MKEDCKESQSMAIDEGMRNISMQSPKVVKHEEVEEKEVETQNGPKNKKRKVIEDEDS